jgi:hypothetical protein
MKDARSRAALGSWGERQTEMDMRTTNVGIPQDPDNMFGHMSYSPILPTNETYVC